MTTHSRRRLLRAAGTALVGGAVAGCAEGGTTTPSSDADVVAGPGGANSFDPEEFTVSVGEAVTWEFDSPGHNVSCVPDHANQVSLPDGAEPFASYGADGNPNQTETQGATYEHTFETAGEYTYVCVPHVRQQMIGIITVEE